VKLRFSLRFRLGWGSHMSNHWHDFSSVINLKVLHRMFGLVGVKSIRLFRSGPSALEYLNSVEDPRLLPHLIMSDLQMPAMTGIELMGHLREIAFFEDPPLVMACSGVSQST